MDDTRISRKNPGLISTFKIHNIILGILFFGLFLRLLNLGKKSLWLDEAFNLAVVKSGIKALWSKTFETHHPPLHFILQGFWIRFGETEFWLRLLPALFGAAAIPLLYVFAKKLAGKEAAITSIGLAAFSPLLIWYSQEARPYSFVVAVGMAAMMAALNLFQKPKLSGTFFFTVIMIAAFYTHYEMILLIPFQFFLLIFLTARKKSLFRPFYYWLSGLILSGIAFIPWWRTPAARIFLSVVKTGSYPGQILSTKLGIKPQILMTILFAATLSILAFGAYFFQILLKKGLIEKALRRSSRGIDIVVFSVVVLSLIASVIPRGYSIKKQIVLFWPYGIFIIGCIWPWEDRYRKKVIAVFLLSIAFSLINIYAVPKDEWREAVDFLDKEYRQGDVIFLLPSYSSFPFEYYNRGKLPSAGIDLDSYDQKIKAIQLTTHRTWLVSNQETFIDPEGKIRSSLAKSAAHLRSKAFYRIQIDLFR
jgi:mannosyltransferase